MAITPKNTTPKEKTTSKKEVAKKIPTRTKYNWVKLKLDFFASDFLDVAPFLRASIGQNTVNNKAVAIASKWRGDEKRKIQEQMRVEAFKKFKANIKGQWDNVMGKMEMAHVAGLENLADMILEQWKVVKRKKMIETKDPETYEVIRSEIVDIEWLTPYLYHGDITSILKHIKLEKWEPTEIMDTNGKSLAKERLDDVKNQKQNKTKKETPEIGLE